MTYYCLPRKETHILVWEEDDAWYEDKENISQAWKRIYSEEFPLKVLKWPDFPQEVPEGLCVIVDFRDCRVAEFNDGRTIVKTFDVDQIWELKK